MIATVCILIWGLVTLGEFNFWKLIELTLILNIPPPKKTKKICGTHLFIKLEDKCVNAFAKLD